jgi:hypothetical protein
MMMLMGGRGVEKRKEKMETLSSHVSESGK